MGGEADSELVSPLHHVKRYEVPNPGAARMFPREEIWAALGCLPTYVFVYMCVGRGRGTEECSTLQRHLSGLFYRAKSELGLQANCLGYIQTFQRKSP